MVAGETLRGRHGLHAIRSLRRLENPAAVYNIEVYGEHVYEIGDLGILVHNSCIRGKPTSGNAAPKKTRWDYITEWHDKRATELFGAGKGRNNIGGRNYDKRYKGRDVEYKSDNFTKNPRSQDLLDRMNTQIGKDIENLKYGTANPHWHFEHDPRVAPEMAPLIKRLEDAGIPWTWGSSTPSF